MALKGPFVFYLDMIVDSIVLFHVIDALGGPKKIVENITSFPSTVSELQQNHFGYAKSQSFCFSFCSSLRYLNLTPF